MSASLSILAFGFLSPLLFAAGAACVSIPIIIHLLNKRKFRVVIWAAMEFLLAAQRRNARRLRFQRWLLLAVRCLAILILAAAIAQLVTNSTVFGGLFGGQRTIVVVWDDSYSMGWQRPGTASAFDRSKKLVADWLSAIDAGDRVMIIRASRGSQTSGNKPTLDHSTLAAGVREAALSDAGTDLAAAIQQAADTLKDAEITSRTRHLIVITDFSNSAVRGKTGSGNEERLKKAVAAAQEHATSVRIIDVGSAEQMNVGVTEVRAMRPVVVAGAATDFRVTVMNGTDHPQIDLPLTVTLDGVPVHSEKLGKIEAGAERSVLVEATIPTAGRHYVEARLPADFLPVDDARRLMLDVRREVPVLLVDGSPGDGKMTQGSVTYLWAAYGLSIDGKLGSVFAPRRITELELPTTVLNGFAEVVLSDTAVPTPAVRDNLKHFVQAGGLLMIFPGNRTNAALMNEAFGEHRAGLLPATLGQPVRMENSTEMAQGGGGVAFAPEGFTHPVLVKFGEAQHSGKDVGFLSVQTSQYLKLGVPTDSSVETVLRYAKTDGTAGDPAVVIKPVGKGKAVLFASSADTSWNTFGAKPSFVPFVHELTYHTLHGDTDAWTMEVGDHVDLPVEVANPGVWIGPRNQRVSVGSEMDKEGHARLTSGPLLAAGLYGPGGAPPIVAVNADADEVDIRHIAREQMASALGLDMKFMTEQPKELETHAAVAEDNSGGSDLARNLLLATLGLFLLETLLARMFSVYR